MNNITVDCKGTNFHPNFFAGLIERGMKLSPEESRRAEKLYLLCAALPTAQAGLLHDLVTGKAKYKVNQKNETFLIFYQDEETPPEPETPPHQD